MSIQPAPGQAEFAAWLDAAKQPKTRIKSFESAMLPALGFESQHLSLFGSAAAAGIGLEARRIGIINSDGLDFVTAIAVRSPKRRNGQWNINQNRLIRLLNSNDWSSFYASMMEMLLIIQHLPSHKLSEFGQIEGVTAESIYRFIYAYDKTLAENTEFGSRDNRGFGFEYLSLFWRRQPETPRV